MTVTPEPERPAWFAALTRTIPRLPEPRRTVYRVSFYMAAFYNLVWGTAVIVLPRATLEAAGVTTDPVGLLFWQCIGMFVLVFALGYWAAARQPERFAAFILIALLGKVFGPIGFVYGAFWLEALPRPLGWTIVTNDLIWWPVWVPFVYEAVIRPHASSRVMT